MTALRDEFGELRQLITWNTFKFAAFGLKVNPQPYAGEIQQRRDNGCFNNVNIRHAYKLSHQESGCAHNRRHQLAARGGCCLYSTGKVLMIAQFFHHGNRQRTCSHYISHRTAGNSSHQPR